MNFVKFLRKLFTEHLWTTALIITLIVADHCNTLGIGINDTQREKLCFTQFSTRTAIWLPLTFFICLHNQLSSNCMFLSCHVRVSE